MSDVKSDNTDAPNDDDAKSIVDKAKDAASDIDVQDLMDKAKDAAIEIKDRSVDAAGVLKEKVSGFVGDNEDKIESAIDKTGHFVDEKLTGHKFTDKIDKAQEAAKGAVSKVGNATEGGGDSEDVAAEAEKPVDTPPAPGSEAFEMPPADE